MVLSWKVREYDALITAREGWARTGKALNGTKQSTASDWPSTQRRRVAEGDHSGEVRRLFLGSAVRLVSKVER